MKGRPGAPHLISSAPGSLKNTEVATAAAEGSAPGQLQPQQLQHKMQQQLLDVTASPPESVLLEV